MAEIRFTVPGQPVGKARPRVTKTHAYTPEKTRAYEALVLMRYREAVREIGAKPITGPVKVTILAVFEIPKSYPKWRKKAIARGEEEPIKKPDLDNISKIILDALNGVAWVDDAQIISLDARKKYTESLYGGPCVHVTIEG